MIMTYRQADFTDIIRQRIMMEFHVGVNVVWLVIVQAPDFAPLMVKQGNGSCPQKQDKQQNCNLIKQSISKYKGQKYSILTSSPLISSVA